MMNRNLEPNAPSCALTAKPFRSLSLAKSEGQDRMWTTGQFSKLTGISKRTLQNWSREPESPRLNGGAKPGAGAMLKAASQNPENGYRTYDIDSLFEVAMIELGQDSGLSQDELRRITRDATPGALAAMQSHVDRLVAQRNELDRKIKLIRTVAAVHAARSSLKPHRTPDDFTDFGLTGLITEELVDALALEGECRSDPTESDFDPDSARLAFDNLAGLWAAGFDPTSEQAQRAFDRWYYELSRLFDVLTETSFADSVASWLSGGYSPILLTLRFGEGIAEWLIETAGASTRLQ